MVMCIPAELPGQPPPTLQKAPAANIFSGTVTKLDGDTITVVRRPIGREAVTRLFVRDEQTTVEGMLKLRARVTVRFRPLDDGGFAAVHIIVR